MIYYYYKIENKLNGKKYIGITLYPQIRKNRHFRELRNQTHVNIRLQNAWNKYNEENFFFEIIEEKNFEEKFEAYNYEKELIEKYDSYENGYNADLGGSCGGKSSKLTKEDVFKILSIYPEYPNSGTILGKIFGVDRSTISCTAKGKYHKDWLEEFNQKDEEEKNLYRDIFLEETNFIFLYYTKQSKCKIRKITDEQVYMFLYQQEFNFPVARKILMEHFNLNNYATIAAIFNGTTHKKAVYEYNLMSPSEKEEIKYRYIEKYSKKTS
jgi:hypothetical protein